ncbi:MAG: peptidylprolyl isomerase, partial [Nitrospira sp.]|nr:peptidylprolyl isomerase [Nitrospira sp.]MCA9480923.1 peptidylprolyl isomerase [Nitrospira sp.]
GFMIQGGDPQSKSSDRSRHGTGGPGYQVKAEFNQRPHKRGTLSMARAQDPNSAGSQFFICVADASFLNGQYTVFGEVVSGMDVVDRIVNAPRDGNDNPLDRIEMTVRIGEVTTPE